MTGFPLVNMSSDPGNCTLKLENIMNAAISGIDFAIASANCFTLRVNMKGVDLLPGIAVDVGAPQPGVYLESGNGFYRFVAVDYNRMPAVYENKIYGAEMHGIRLQSRSPFNHQPECFLHLKIYDPRVTEILDGDIEISPHAGTTSNREVVWKKRDNKTVGLEAFIVFHKNGNVLRVKYPGGLKFVAMRGGKLELLPPGSDVERAYLREQENIHTASAAEAAKKTASTFPSRDLVGDWKQAIAEYAESPDPVREMFMGTVYSRILQYLANFGVNDEGLWEKSQVFQMHTLYEVCRFLPKEYLGSARKALTEMGKREHAELPAPIVEKFNLRSNAQEDLPSRDQKPGKNRAAADKKKADRRRRDADERAKKKGSSQPKPLHAQDNKK